MFKTLVWVMTFLLSLIGAPLVAGAHSNAAAIGTCYRAQGGSLELPVSGATGWAASAMPMYGAPVSGASIVLNLSPGQAFTIIEEYDIWWNVRLGYDGVSGWVLHRGCFINLPDVIPSIVFDITNAYGSLKHSYGYEIPNITRYALYDAWAFNYRLGRYEFIVPALYSTSMLIFEAQQAALADGNTIVIYEAFRPRATQQSVVSNLQGLMNNNANVRRAINAPPWSLNWFISTGISNHQRGVAFDVGLGRVIAQETRTSGAYIYTHITTHKRHVMPTLMHELSPLAVTFAYPVSSTCPNTWRAATPADSMTEGALLLQGYLTNVGFIPLASEWWHFNDPYGIRIANDARINGEFFTDAVYSKPPFGGDF